VGKNFTVTATGAQNDLYFSPTQASIRGNLSMKSGGGDIGISSQGALFIGKNATLFVQEQGSSEWTVLSASGDLVVGGSVKSTVVKAGSLALQLVGSGSGSLEIGGNVMMSATDVGNTFTQSLTGGIAARVGGSVTIKGTPRAAAQFTDGGDDAGSLVGGSVKITGQNSIVIRLAGIISGNSLFAVAGDDRIIEVDPEGAARTLFLGAVSMQIADGTIGTASIVINDTTFARGLKLKDGARPVQVVLNDTAVLGTFMADLGAGSDTLRLDALAGTVGTTFYGPVLLLGGAGDDTFEFATAADTQFAAWSKFVIDGGDGTDELTVGPNTFFAVPRVEKNLE
jgi:hypothetical protein